MKTHILVALLLLTGSAHAQHEREKQYLDGAGMGYARAAELNHFPGPMHVLELAREMMRIGKLSGAVGTYANVDPSVEEFVCQKLSLKPANVATQVIQRGWKAGVELMSNPP